MSKGTRAAFAAIGLAASIALSATACSADAPADADWQVGTWTKTYDEDNDPADSITFRDDGTFATYDADCKAHTNSYFVRDDLIFLVIPMTKGPVALVFKPTEDKSILSFTSPRTRNVALFTRAEKPHCAQ